MSQGMVKHKARKPDFELTKPSTGQEYIESNNGKKKRAAGLPAYKRAQATTEMGKKQATLH